MSCTRKVGILSVGPVCPVATGSLGPLCPVTIGSVGPVRDRHLVIINNYFDLSYKRKTVLNNVEFRIVLITNLMHNSFIL
jgi:uncharacterized protein YkvS